MCVSGVCVNVCFSQIKATNNKYRCDTIFKLQMKTNQIKVLNNKTKQTKIFQINYALI